MRQYQTILQWCLLLWIVTITFILLRLIKFSLFVDYGFSDEGFALLQAKTYSLKNEESLKTYAFATMTGNLYRLVGGNIVLFRLTGVLACVIVCLVLLAVCKSFYKKIDISIAVFSLMLAFLFIPSGFNFLLITPSYQLILQLAAILFIVAEILRASSKYSESTNQVINFLICLCLLFTLISRPTGVLPIIFLIMKYTRQFFRDKLSIALLLFGITYLCLNENIIERSIFAVQAANNYAPENYNFIVELKDFIQFLYIVVLPFFGAKWFSKSVFWKQRFERFKVFIIASFISFSSSIILLLIFSTDPNQRNPNILVLHLFSWGIFIELHQKWQSREITKFLSISFLPVMVQLGSSISLVSELSPYLISFSTLLLFYQIERFKTRDMDSKSVSNLLCSNFLLLMLFTIALFHSSGSLYDKAPPSFSRSYDTATGLFTPDEKIDSMIKASWELRERVKPEVKIIDLSGFHPGLIYRLSHLSGRASLPDFSLAGKFDDKINFVVQELTGSSSRDWILLVQTPKNLDRTKCRKIKSLLPYEIWPTSRSTLLDNFRYEVIATYVSNKNDVSLYPKNLDILKKCK